MAAGRGRGQRLPAERDRHPQARASRCGWRSGPAAPASATTRRATRRTASTRCAAYALKMADRPRPRAGRTWCCSSATRCTPTRPPRRCRSSSAAAARHRASRRARSSRTSRSTPTSTELAWSDPLNRWLLSTLPSAMIFDDHDVRDDWNTSYAWKQEIEQTDWWHERIVVRAGVLLGLPAPRQPVARTSATKDDAVAAGRAARTGDGRARPHRRRSTTWPSGSTSSPRRYRWSYARDFGDVPAGGRRLPGRPGARAGPPRRCSTTGELALARRAAARRRATTC